MNDTYERKSWLSLDVLFTFIDDEVRERKLDALLERISKIGGYCCHYSEKIN